MSWLVLFWVCLVLCNLSCELLIYADKMYDDILYRELTALGELSRKFRQHRFPCHQVLRNNYKKLCWIKKFDIVKSIILIAIDNGYTLSWIKRTFLELKIKITSFPNVIYILWVGTVFLCDIFHKNEYSWKNYSSIQKIPNYWLYTMKIVHIFQYITPPPPQK